MSEFFDMGGHGAYIWPAYAITTIVIVGILIQTLRTMWQRELKLKILRQERRGEKEQGEE
ncbi:MAG: heme exporter protein CcmD [Pseudomonadota bacterium]|nr:heme exporter protein CcmD [Pseudomonadota bacterium]